MLQHHTNTISATIILGKVPEALGISETEPQEKTPIAMAGSGAFLQVCRVEGWMDFLCSLDGSRESVECHVVGGIAQASVWEQTHSPTSTSSTALSQILTLGLIIWPNLDILLADPKADLLRN